MRKLSKEFLKSENISINNIKPKVITNFLTKGIEVDPRMLSEGEERFETIRDLVEKFYECKMSLHDIKINPLQKKLIENLFLKLSNMK